MTTIIIITALAVIVLIRRTAFRSNEKSIYRDAYQSRNYSSKKI